jgi:tetratricopeptide (TPR) repeat protein
VWLCKAELEKAVDDLSEAIRLQPDCAEAYSYRGQVWMIKGRYKEANQNFREAIRVDPGNWVSYERMARIAAICPDARFRDGKLAVKYATAAGDLTQWKVAANIDTLGAAYAETGDFTMAVKCQEKAISVTSSDDEKNLFNSRLALYRAGKPYRDEPARAR